MQPGERVGKYVLEECLGAGTFAEVFAATHPVLKRRVALKILKPEIAAIEQYLGRFLEDAQAAAHLDHRNIVRVHDIEEAPVPFIVMELVDGTPLDQLLKDRGRLAVEEAVRIARDVAAALAAADEAQIVHRDVKPANILIERRTGRAKLADFNAARREREDRPQLTEVGQRMGTPRYMAPEQWMGVAVDGRTDLFALGALLYEMLAGEPAFKAGTVEAVMQVILLREPKPLAEVRPGLLPGLVRLVERLLAKSPDARPTHARAVVGELEAVLASLTPAPEPPKRPQVVWRKVAAGVALVVVAGGAVAGFGLWPPRPEPEPVMPTPPPSYEETVVAEGSRALPPAAERPPVAQPPPAPARPGPARPEPPNPAPVIERPSVAASPAAPAAVQPVPAWPVPAVTEISGRYPEVRAVFRDRLKDGADCAACPEMVVVPSGSFEMGSTQGERDWVVSQGGSLDGTKDEQPQRRVTISQPLAVSVHEVTQGEFARFVAATGYKAEGGCYTWTGSEWKLEAGLSWRAPGFAQTDGHPVVCVSWLDAQAYVKWLSEETGKAYRLLSEAEWEYAARAGTAAMRYWGDDRGNSEACRYANGADQVAKEKFSWVNVLNCRDGFVYTAPVGSYGANGWQLRDMLGNVLEWVADCYHESYEGAPEDGRPRIEDNCPRRVLRGGSWLYYPGGLRSAYRGRNGPENRYFGAGFRVARMLTP